MCINAYFQFMCRSEYCGQGLCCSCQCLARMFSLTGWSIVAILKAWPSFSEVCSLLWVLLNAILSCWALLVQADPTEQPGEGSPVPLVLYWQQIGGGWLGPGLGSREPPFPGPFFKLCVWWQGLLNGFTQGRLPCYQEDELCSQQRGTSPLLQALSPPDPKPTPLLLQRPALHRCCECFR